MEKHGIQKHSTFTGKERDEEKERSRGPFASERGDEPRSGIPYCSVYSYTYFGARYMDYELMAMWLSVDPLADKYPSISPYAYCAGNPVRLMDPDGNEAIENDDWYKDGKGQIKWDPTVTNETTLKEGEEYLGNTVLLTNDEGQTIYGDENGKLHSSVPLKEVNITADATVSTRPETENNTALDILKAGTAIAVATSQLDSPFPGPADAAAVGIEALTVIVAGVAWAIDNMFQPCI